MNKDLERPERRVQRRSKGDRRRGSIRRGDRRKASVAVTTERRSGADRRSRDRRAKHPRRLVSDRRRRTPPASPASRLTPHDRDRARRLPGEVSAASGTLEQRLSRITRQMWPNFPLPVRAGLIEALLPVLAPVAKGGLITDELRRQCEELVGEWIGKYR